jgi:methylphosphonate synthase
LMQHDPDYLRKLGARLLSEANDLKRTPEALGQDLGWAAEDVNAVLGGNRDRATAERLARDMAQFYPISLRDVWIDGDDTDHGVRLMEACASAASARIFDRVDRHGRLSPYYEYRDTAMSRGAPFKPEWILELRQVSDADPRNPDVAYNKGHLMHQATFFVGPVNFYWKTGGECHCAQMNTGDSNYITPFVPHSFTSRDSSQPGLIIAVTYGTMLRQALSDFAHIGAENAETLAGDLRDSQSARRALLARHLLAETLSEKELSQRLTPFGIAEARTDALLGGAEPTLDEIGALAAALNVRTTDVMLTPLRPGEDVVTRHALHTPVRSWPAGNRPSYRFRELARSPHQPQLKGFSIEVLTNSSPELQHGLHQYVYNFGDQAVRLRWNGSRNATLGPGDSAYVQPMVPHAFERANGPGAATLLIVRIPGSLTDAILTEFASLGESRKRAIEETDRWY